MYNIPLILVKKRNVPMYTIHQLLCIFLMDQDCPLMMSWKCPKIRGKTKHCLDLNKVLMTCHVKIWIIT